MSKTVENLALKLRPSSLEEFCGQRHLVAPSSPLYTLIKEGSIPHAIFFGPAGVGKTTLARIAANTLDMPFYELDATSLKVEAFRSIFSKHKNALVKPLIFIDEVHRLSKTQQEVLLLPMENKEAVIIGASTENPYFTLSSGIRSRSMLFEFYELTSKDLEDVLQRAKDSLRFSLDEDAKAYLISSSAGDSRALLNLLEFAIKVDSHVSLKLLKSLRPSALKDGVSSDESHYNLSSAMIKSIRGSDIDASLYYLARLIDGGESADFIARRLLILASEDIGNANPNALGIASDTMQSVRLIGYPESRIILAQCVIYLASCPKSNSAYQAINEVQKYVREQPKQQIPEHLVEPLKPTYLYPHSYGGWVEQKYMSKPERFYSSSGIGFEKTLQEWVEKIKKS